MSMLYILAHTDAVHEQTNVDGLAGFLHQPTGQVLVTVTTMAALLFIFLKLLKVSFPARLLIVVASTIAASVLYMPHNPSVTGIVLSVGFIVTFLLTFTMLGNGK